LETFDIAEVTLAIEDALRLGTISFDAVHHLLLCRIERRPPRLDMENYPHLPLAQVRTTQAADYMTLLVKVSGNYPAMPEKSSCRQIRPPRDIRASSASNLSY
jgi:hypothetical protein